MHAQMKKTRLTDGSSVWSVCIFDEDDDDDDDDDDDRHYSEIECYSYRHACAMLDAIKLNSPISCRQSVQGE